MNKIKQFLFVGLALIVALPVGAYVASSDNYRIQSDSINFGGQLSTSANYKLEDTLGEISTGTSSDAINLQAGYQAMAEDVYLSVSSPADVTLSPTIDTTIGGIADGQALWTIITNDPAGYSMTVAANTSPALHSSVDSFSDLNVAGTGTPDFSWFSPAGYANFGYTVEGPDLDSSFWDNVVICGVGALDTLNKCWLDFSTSAKTVSLKNSSNHPTGSDTTIKLRAQIDPSRNLIAGTYQAVINVVITAL